MDEKAFALGLDLGQTTDFTALSVGEIKPCTIRLPVERFGGEVFEDDPIPTRNTFLVELQHLARLPKRMPYPLQVEEAGKVISKIKQYGRVLLVIDQTGVGRPVVDMFRMAGLGVPIWPVTIATSAMAKAKRDPDTHDWTVPKKDLIGALVALASSDRFLVSNGIDPEIKKIWTNEMREFKLKFTESANVTMESWRDGAHDDLVLSSALMAWAASRWASPGGLH